MTSGPPAWKFAFENERNDLVDFFHAERKALLADERMLYPALSPNLTNALCTMFLDDPLTQRVQQLMSYSRAREAAVGVGRVLAPRQASRPVVVARLRPGGARGESPVVGADPDPGRDDRLRDVADEAGDDAVRDDDAVHDEAARLGLGRRLGHGADDHVAALDGGWNAWLDLGLPTEGPAPAAGLSGKTCWITICRPSLAIVKTRGSAHSFVTSFYSIGTGGLRLEAPASSAEDPAAFTRFALTRGSEPGVDVVGNAGHLRSGEWTAALHPPRAPSRATRRGRSRTRDRTARHRM